MYKKILSSSLLAAGLFAANPCLAALTFWTHGDLMIIHGKSENGDQEKLKEKLTPAIKTIIVRSPRGMDFDVARNLADQIKRAQVTTVAHGNCTELTCAMIFLSGKQRQFSGVGPAKSHTVTIGIGEKTHVLSGTNTPILMIHDWWLDNTKLNSKDLTLQREGGFFAIVPNNSKFDRKVFFPTQAEFSKGSVLHCSGVAKSQNLVDCTPIKEASSLSKGIVTTDDLFIDSRLIEADDIAAPAAEKITEVPAVPSIDLSDNCKEMYKNFLRQDSPRAFVVSNMQGCHWASIGIRPNERAMQNCQKEVISGKECRFYAVDNKLVFTPFDQPIPTASANPQTSEKPQSAPLRNENISLLLAKNASNEDGPIGVSGTFPVEGKVFAYLTIRWGTEASIDQKQNIEARWFSESKLISTQKQEATLTASPQRMWFSTLTADLGTGKSRVEIYAQDKLIGSKEFDIVDKF